MAKTPAAKKKSTTPIADEKHEKYAALFAKHEHISCNRNDFLKARCKKCDGRFRFVMSEYAMWFDGHDNLMTCDCGRMVWFDLSEDAKHGYSI